MVENGIQKLARFLRSHRGLMVLLLVGLTISLLALAAPQAWATPDQNPLRSTPPTPTPTPPAVGGETIAAGSSTLSVAVVALVVLVACVSTAGIVWKRSPR